jgi:hypothetical protein
VHGRNVGVDLSIWLYSHGSRFALDILVRRDYRAITSVILSLAARLTAWDANLVFVADNRREAYQRLPRRGAPAVARRCVGGVRGGCTRAGKDALLGRAFHATVELQDAVVAAHLRR